MTIRGKYLGGRKVELEQDLNLPPDTEVFFIIEEIKKSSDPEEKRLSLKDCFTKSTDNDISIESEIRKLRQENQQNIEKKFENWNT